MTSVGDNRNFAGLLWQAASKWPDKAAIEDEAGRHTYRDLKDSAAAFADVLSAGGVRPGDPVCLLMRRGAGAAAAFFGASAIGAVVCLVNEAYKTRQIAHVLESTGCKHLVVAAEFWDSMQRIPLGAALRIDPDQVGPVGLATPIYRADADPAQLTFTSGSTGRPKGVLSSHANLWAGAEVVPAYLGIVAGDRIASLLPFSFVYGFSQLCCALLTGSTLVVERATLPIDIVRGLRDARISVLAAVPPLWMQLLQGGLEATPLPHLRIGTCAGGKLAPEIVRRVRVAQPHMRLFLMYGLTEVFRSTFLPPEEIDAHPDSMGRAVPGSEVFVLRDDGTPCGVDEVGELVHSGPTVALGYWADPETTARVFRRNPLRSTEEGPVVFSGDLVRRDAEGRLYYVGRRDRMIKTLGFRVSPEEIADTLLASGLLQEAAVTSEPDVQRGERIVAHVCLKPGIALAQLRQFCGLELPRYMQPARYREYTQLPRNASGKIDLVALAALSP